MNFYKKETINFLERHEPHWPLLLPRPTNIRAFQEKILAITQLAVIRQAADGVDEGNRNLIHRLEVCCTSHCTTPT